ncbi:MAG: response regulator transcription factor [Bacteroidia bacterium]
MIKCIAVDDEPPALQLIASYIEKTPFLKLEKTFYSSVEAFEYSGANEIDIAFLDINMPDLSGLELSKILDKNIKVIFTTAYEQYAIEGYKVSAVDYLLKPFSYGEFLSAAQKAKQFIESQNVSVNEHNRSFIFLKSDYKIHKVDFNDILFAENQKDYIKIHRKGKKPLMVLMPLKDLEAQLPSTSFIKVHRSFIVNLLHIESIEKWRIAIGEEKVPVSDAYKEILSKALNL